MSSPDKPIENPDERHAYAEGNVEDPVDGEKPIPERNDQTTTSRDVPPSSPKLENVATEESPSTE